MRECYRIWCSICRGVPAAVVLFCLFPGFLYAGSETDTLAQVRQNLEYGSTGRAYRLIKHYSRSHPDDFNTAWLFAKTAYLANKMSTS